VVTTLLSDDAPQLKQIAYQQLFVGFMTEETTRNYGQ